VPPKGKHGHGGGAANGDHPANHGADVSAVAREAPRGHGEQHGAAVSEAAHSSSDAAPEMNPAPDRPEERR
jgi:hypothetical protein